MSPSHLTDDQASAIREAVAEAVLTACEQGRKGLDNDPDAHLVMVAAASVAAVATSRLLRQSITGARGAGHSWETVGRLLGISSQAAQQRFGTPAADRTGFVPDGTPRPQSARAAARVQRDGGVGPGGATRMARRRLRLPLPPRRGLAHEVGAPAAVGRRAGGGGSWRTRVGTSSSRPTSTHLGPTSSAT